MTSASNSFFSRCPPVAEQFHLRLMREFPADPSPRKRGYLFGTYRGEDGRPVVMPEVVRAEVDLAEEGDDVRESRREISEKFSFYAQEMLLGKDNEAFRQGRVVSHHCNGNGNAIRVALDFLRWALDADTVVIPMQSWLSHDVMAKASGYGNILHYRYWKESDKSVDMSGLMEDLMQAPEGSVVIFQPCGHNPTGMDPTKEQWRQIVSLMKTKNLFPMFDTAYQGFASGDLDEDAWSIRYFISQGMEILSTQSFSKNFGLYSERVGNITVVLNNREMVPKALHELERTSIGFTHMPPFYGARIVVKILEDHERRKRWERELRNMNIKTRNARRALRTKLESLTGSSWSHITEQCGMFSYTGITAEQAEWLKEERKLYIYPSGRMNIAGLSQADVGYFAESVKEALELFPCM